MKNVIKEKILKSLQATQEVGVEGLTIQGLALIIQKLDSQPAIPDMYNDTKKFVDKMGLNKTDIPRQIELLKEEYHELIDAETEAQKLDALIDTMYVCIVLMVLNDFPMYQPWNEVSRSNLSKDKGPKGTGKLGGSVVKGKSYTAPKGLEEMIQKWRKCHNHNKMEAA